MLKFLLNRPIAVLMAFTACFIIGLATWFALPVSLLPDIAIPEITVQLSGRNTSARELENTVVRPIRLQLMQVGHLRDIQSETRDGSALIRLSFDFGTNTNLAFIEVNEKIDAAMNSLPRETERPRVIKASATDIPVFCLNLTLRTSGNQATAAEEEAAGFPSLCEFAETVIRRRIEQLPEVAMVDVTGTVGQQLQIVPDMKKLAMAGLSLDDLTQSLQDNNVEPGSMTVRDGYYQYNIRFASLLRTLDDVRSIYIRKGERILQMKDVASISIVPQKETGLSLSNGKRAVTLAVIKQADENMASLKKALKEVTESFAAIYPDVEFGISRNQTELLDYTISNLQQNLTLGFILICLVAVLFLGDVKSPFVIGLSMIASIVVSFLFFYLFHASLNIISLSGLILALGMMIDSAIIVTENISQYRARGDSVETACARGTTEVITPMLSSTLTTIAVFVPLVFMSGIAGAIFFDQAFAVTVGLLVSYVTGIMLLPVLYKMAYSRPPSKKRSWLNVKLNNPFKGHALDKFYDSGIAFIFRHKTSALFMIVLSIGLCVFLFGKIPKSRMPDIDRNELVATIEWNEHIHVDENRMRVDSLFGRFASSVTEYTAYIGQQQYLLNRDREWSVSEAELYFKTAETSDIKPLEKAITSWLEKHYPSAICSFSPPATVFEKLFVTSEADIVAELYARNKSVTPLPADIHRIENVLREQTGHPVSGPAFDRQLNLSIDRHKLLLYNVDYNEVYSTLKTAFRDNEVAMLRSYQQYLPITVSGAESSVEQVMRNTFLQTRPATDNSASKTKTEKPKSLPLQSFVRITPDEDLKTITAGKNGEYIPFRFYDVGNDVTGLMNNIKQSISRQKDGDAWDTGFSGSFFSNRKMINELVIILFISILLMYFILAAQFESFLQPLIVLLEIPIDVAAALLVLWICGHSLNLMSAIGIVVTCGIIINDSILKIDAINELRKVGTPLMEAIHEAGRRRLRPIVMTSLTTILAMTPLLFSFDMGSELQKPLSIAMISAMLVGTAVSLFIIPLAYYLIYRKKEI
ncbi:MAG: efflux RND transporter permease subunit [Tannerella sp.]|jgi:multidrug efflux pump subunit AcrB|nr:efflux RND transporter permease subunit [Tannerella sp.]